jgi:hypothetical protein
LDDASGGVSDEEDGGFLELSAIVKEKTFLVTVKKNTLNE